MNSIYIFLSFYYYAVEFLKNIYDFFVGMYNDLEMVVLDGTVVKATYYDYHIQKKVVFFDNTSVIKVLYLMFLKYVLAQDITYYTSLDNAEFNLPGKQEFSSSVTEWGITEIVYYHDRQRMKCFTKFGVVYYHHRQRVKCLTKFANVTMDKILNPTKKPQHKKFLYVTISDQCDITRFINDHISSFNETNQVTVHDIYNIAKIDAHLVAPVAWNENIYIKFIDTDTVEETVYRGNDHIILD